MNDNNTNISNTLGFPGLHHLRRNMAARMIFELSDMPVKCQKIIKCNCIKGAMEKYIYAKPSKRQMETALKIMDA